MNAKALNTVVSVPFDCELEIHNREQFQKDGHMLFNLYAPNPVEGQPDVLRPWDGTNVYAIRLMYKGAQVHRVMSDSLEDAKRLMTEGLRNLTLVTFAVQSVQAFDRQQFERLNRERVEFAQWISERLKKEIAAGKFQSAMTPDGLNIFEVAKHYIKPERMRSVRHHVAVRSPKRKRT
jgi:hypothetical protein